MRLSRLDGIRGIAIAMVFAHHVLHFTPGWIGVDLFFVLSGYLITTILRRDRFDRFYWGPFYLKRAARILPPLAVCFLLAALLTTFPWHRLGLWYVLFAANIAEARHPLQGDKELTILWSLAVEEQFYLVWPFAVRFLSRRTLLWILGAVLCLEPVLRAVYTPRIGWWPMYILTPFRLDGLTAGSLLAILLESERWAERLRRFAGPLALVFLLVFAGCSRIPGFWYRADSYSFNIFGYSLLAGAATFGIAWVLLRPNTPAARALAHPALVFIGLISYSAYLYHVMVVQAIQLAVVRIGFNHMRTVSPVTAALTVLLAWASYRFYEQPIMRAGQRAVTRLQQADPVAMQRRKPPSQALPDGVLDQAAPAASHSREAPVAQSR